MAKIKKALKKVKHKLKRKKQAMSVCKSIIIDGVEYTPSGQRTIDGEYKMIRCDRSGVFYGIIESRKDREVVIKNARRVWYWTGAASLSQLAVDGTKNPGSCKFPEAVSQITVLDAIEILDLTDKARKSLDSVSIWKA